MFVGESFRLSRLGLFRADLRFGERSCTVRSRGGRGGWRCIVLTYLLMLLTHRYLFRLCGPNLMYIF